MKNRTQMITSCSIPRVGRRWIFVYLYPMYMQIKIDAYYISWPFGGPKILVYIYICIYIYILDLRIRGLSDDALLFEHVHIFKRPEHVLLFDGPEQQSFASPNCSNQNGAAPWGSRKEEPLLKVSAQPRLRATNSYAYVCICMYIYIWAMLYKVQNIQNI